jgi:hypothetical protein
MGFYLNLGQQYAHSGESDYAQLLRIIATNAGVPIAVLLKELMSAHLNDQRLINTEMAGNRSTYHAESSRLPIRARPLRQCDACHQQLFHSNLFDVPALTRCPAHGRALTERCPACGQTWPSIYDTRKRTCSTCSIPNIETRYGLRDEDLVDSCNRLIAPALDLLKRHYPVIDLLANHYEQKCSVLHYTSYYGAAFMQAYWTHREQQAEVQLLDTLGVSDDAIHVTKTTLDYGPVSRARDRAPLLRTILRQTRYRVLQRINRWITRHSVHEHNLVHETDHILDEHSDTHPFCPICTALIIWLHLNAEAPFPHRLYGRFEDFRTYRYAMDSMQFKTHIFTYAKTEHQSYYPLPTDFIQHIYARDLQYEFVELLTVLTAKFRKHRLDASIEQAVMDMREQYMQAAFFLHEDQLLHTYALQDPLSLLEYNPKYDISYCEGNDYTAIIPSFNSASQAGLGHWLGTFEQYSKFENQLALGTNGSTENHVDRWYEMYSEQLESHKDNLDQFALF